MSIIITPEFWLGATARAIAEGLRMQGEIVSEVDISRYLIATDGMLLRIASRALLGASMAAYNRALLRTAEAERADMLFAVKGLGIRSGTIKRAAEMGMITVIYYPDPHFSYPLLDPAIIELADLVCTTKRYQLETLDRMRGPGRSLLVQHGYSPAAHRPLVPDLEEDGYAYDICYAGNPSPAKLEWLIPIAEAFSDKRIIIAGHRWRDLARGTVLEPFIAERPFVAQSLAWLHQHSRINIAVHSGLLKNASSEDDVSTRTFEIPACRGFMLHVDNSEVRSLFEVPSQIDTFSTPEDMCEKIGFYLDRPDLRASMIDRAFARAVPAYSYHARAAEILTAARAISPRG
jgi:spore maturation protein CgeB